MVLVLVTVYISILVRVQAMPEVWERLAAVSISPALAQADIHGAAELVAVIVINILALAVVMLPVVRAVLVTVNIRLAVVQVLAHGLMVRAFVQVHINTLVRVRDTRVVQARLVMANTLLVIALVGIVGMVHLANIAVALINIPVRGVIFPVVLAHLVVENIQLVLVIVHILGEAGPALAQVHISTLAQERATRVAQVLLAAENINLVIAQAVMIGMVHRANIAAALINIPVRVVIFPVVWAVLAMANIPLVIVPMDIVGLMVCVPKLVLLAIYYIQIIHVQLLKLAARRRLGWFHTSMAVRD